MMILTVLLLAACGPVPGGLLAGTRSATPESWHDVMGDAKICEVQSRPAKPHSIQLACFLFEDKLYVQSSGRQRAESAALRRAVIQTEDWQRWIRDNLSAARERLQGISSTEAWVLIGRSMSLD
ncbi:MAG: hypothetical protein HQ497_12430, partial [SAR86 cluster bacterium]|nr:hypothetical protein [SAR86 cluster bacterium]